MGCNTDFIYPKEFKLIGDIQKKKLPNTNSKLFGFISNGKPFEITWKQPSFYIFSNNKHQNQTQDKVLEWNGEFIEIYNKYFIE